jgi:hypothetical protein
VSDQRWFWPKLSAEYSTEYSAETEYLARATETESQNYVFLVFFLKKSIRPATIKKKGLMTIVGPSAHFVYRLAGAKKRKKIEAAACC